jgi:CheY-like chemotaxis protein
LDGIEVAQGDCQRRFLSRRLAEVTARTDAARFLAAAARLPAVSPNRITCLPRRWWLRFGIVKGMYNLGTVLLVDDDASVREPLRRLLTDAGYNVRTASNGKEALELLNAGGATPELFLLDLMMPEMTGLELITALRLNPSWADIPVVVLTGTRGYSADELKVDAVLLKPFNAVDVRAAIYLARNSKRRPENGGRG